MNCLNVLTFQAKYGKTASPGFCIRSWRLAQFWWSTSAPRIRGSWF
jgi:hypothetical protein